LKGKTHMKMIHILIVDLALVLPSFGQTSLSQTTLSAAITQTQNCFNVASRTGINSPGTTGVGSLLYILDPGAGKGEAVRVTSLPVTPANQVCVIRGTDSTSASGHISGAIVVHGDPGLFRTVDPSGACSASTQIVTPYINLTNGRQWLCGLAGTWVPGWQNDLQVSPTATVASAASLITPSGPLFTISGTAAITGFNRPVGFANGQICAIPSGIFTTTAASNIALASTAVVNRTLCWVYNSSTDKFVPTY
jgi:hypothetical protein